MKLVVDLKKAQPLEDADGVLTRRGMEIAHSYAKRWVEGQRDLSLERQFPELAGFFYDLRIDSELARQHAIEG